MMIDAVRGDPRWNYTRVSAERRGAAGEAARCTGTTTGRAKNTLAPKTGPLWNTAEAEKLAPPAAEQPRCILIPGKILSLGKRFPRIRRDGVASRTVGRLRRARLLRDICFLVRRFFSKVIEGHF